MNYIAMWLIKYPIEGNRIAAIAMSSERQLLRYI